MLEKSKAYLKRVDFENYLIDPVKQRQMCSWESLLNIHFCEIVSDKTQNYFEN